MARTFNAQALLTVALAGLLPFSMAGQAPPIVGKWSWTRSANNCTETYEYRADGTFDVTSGAEVASGKFEISPTPDANGFFALKSQTLKTNGGRDCSDSSGQTDDKPYTVYVIFHAAQPLHLVCEKPLLENCFGPFRRVRE
jgi:hypothetical protein